jgi:transcriptional regulator with XRE-family HTH domain
MSTKFANELRSARKKPGFTQRDLAHLIECHQSTIAAFEKGKSGPTIDQLIAVSVVFGRAFVAVFEELVETAREKLRRNILSLPDSAEWYSLRSRRNASIDDLGRRLKEAQDIAFDDAGPSA